MWNIFQRWGRLAEVFISSKLNWRGNRFEFVRFYDVRNAAKLENELDVMRIGAMKLFVNLPKYRKNANKNLSNAITKPVMTKVKDERSRVVKQWRVNKASEAQNGQMRSIK